MQNEQPLAHDSETSELSDFENDFLSMDEITRVLALDNVTKLSHYHWLNQLKLNKWQKQLEKV